MSLKIDQDHSRFRAIVRGKIRQNLRKYVSQGELIGRKGKDLVSIPIPQIDIPHFSFGDKQRGGSGQGDGEPGDPMGGDPDEDGDGGRQAGQNAGEHALEVDVTLDELAAILGEELELPDIQDKGKSKIINAKDRYTSIRRVGPESLRNFRRTYREALKRQIATGTYSPSNPVVVPIPNDKRYRSWKTESEPVANAVIIYMMDVSGSMGDEQKEIVRIESFWIDAWLQKQYKGLDSRYIIHDAVAREVDRETFFHTRESGGTMISSAYKLCAQMIDDHYPPEEWNIYPFHFSDGDNWSMDDTLLCVDLLKNKVLPRVNLFAYGQVESPYGSGQFVKDLREHFGKDERVVTSEIRDKDAIVGSIKEFLGKGREMSEFALKTALPAYLREEQNRIERLAAEAGLDFFPTVFEILTYDQMNEIAAYGGFPNRYPHWRFGMEYERLAKSYEYGLSKIYEMVINNNPSYAYLLEGNSLVDQKLVMAHVYGHVDFFKNNYCFRSSDLDTGGRTVDPVRRPTDYDPNRRWIDKMANHGSRVRRVVARQGINKVEEFLDYCLTLENLVDLHAPFTGRRIKRPVEDEGEMRATEVPRLRAKDYMESFINPEEYLEEQKKKIEAEREKAKKFPEHSERDVLLFLLDNAPLERWEREILEVVREEAYYFAPQWQTKIMNEGWATYWHSRLMTEKILDASEIIDYADHAAGVLATSGGRLNPYKLGVELYRHIEERWDKGQFGKEWEDCDDLEAKKNWNLRLGLGKKKVFEVRALYNDVTFIDEFLTPEFCREHKLFSFAWSNRNERYEIESREFRTVKEKLLFQLTNGGNPFIYVEDANFDNRGELLLRHDHQGLDLRMDYAKEVMRSMLRVWKRPVNVTTVAEGKPVMLRYDGKEHTTRHLRP